MVTDNSVLQIGLDTGQYYYYYYTTTTSISAVVLAIPPLKKKQFAKIRQFVNNLSSYPILTGKQTNGRVRHSYPLTSNYQILARKPSPECDGFYDVKVACCGLLRHCRGVDPGVGGPEPLEICRRGQSIF